MTGRGQRLFALLALTVVGILATAVIAAPAKPATSPTGKSCSMGKDVPAADVVPGLVPVLLVHGILASPDMWHEKISGQDLSLWDKLQEGENNHTGAQPYGFSYEKLGLSWVTDDGIGPELSRTINCLAQASGRKVVVVAHSMGGLATQFALSQPIDGNKPCASGPQGQENCTAINVATVVTAGTPFAGSLLLTALQVARVGGDVTAVAQGNPRLAVAMEQILSLCARVGQESLGKKANVGEDVCRVVGTPDSPVGQALQVPPLGKTRELPAWPSAVPLLAEAGSIDVELPPLTISMSPLVTWPLVTWPQITVPLPPVKIGDGVVMTDSQEAAATKLSTPISCAIDASEYVPAGLSSFSTPACGHNALFVQPDLVGVILSAVHTTVEAQSVKPLSSVDWKDTSYTIACHGLAAGPLTVELRNGTGHAPADAENSQGYDVSLVSGGLTSGDLTNDKRPEVAVLLGCHPSEMGPSNVADEVQVFTEGLGGPKMLARLTPPFPNSPFPPLFDAIPGPPQEFVFSISSDRLLTTVEAWAPDDCHACASIHRVISWRWDGTKFVSTDIMPQITPTTASPTASGAQDGGSQRPVAESEADIAGDYKFMFSVTDCVGFADSCAATKQRAAQGSAARIDSCQAGRCNYTNVNGGRVMPLSFDGRSWGASGPASTGREITCSGRVRPTGVTLTVTVLSAATVDGKWVAKTVRISETDKSAAVSADCPAATFTITAAATRS